MQVLIVPQQCALKEGTIEMVTDVQVRILFESRQGDNVAVLPSLASSQGSSYC